ncbi:hypothetical protein K1X76_06695 [bacterium]|nr:hypothetical protein [bacterium]
MHAPEIKADSFESRMDQLQTALESALVDTGITRTMHDPDKSNYSAATDYILQLTDASYLPEFTNTANLAQWKKVAELYVRRDLAGYFKSNYDTDTHNKMSDALLKLTQRFFKFFPNESTSLLLGCFYNESLDNAKKALYLDYLVDLTKNPDFDKEKFKENLTTILDIVRPNYQTQYSDSVESVLKELEQRFVELYPD